MKRFAGLALLLSVLTACASAHRPTVGPCYGDRVQTSPGVILSLSSGLTYQVFPSDNRISMTWLPMDRLIVCPIGGSAVTMTNTTQKGEQVRAVRIFNLPWYVWPQT